MLARSTVVLGIISLGLFILALIGSITGRHDAIVADGEGEAFLPEFVDQIPEISKIKIITPTSSVTLFHSDGIWQVQEKDGYPADGFRVQVLVNALSSSLKIEPRTNDPDYFDKLGLAETAQTVLFENENGKVISTLRLGDQFMSPAGIGVMSFAWDEASNRVWTVSGFPEISAIPTFWVEADVLHLSQRRVKKVTVMLASSEPFAIGREAPENTNFFPLQSMGGAFNQKAVNELGFGLSNVILEDVEPAQLDMFFHVADTRFETFDGLNIDVSLYDKDGIVWASFFAHYDTAVVEAEGTPSILYDAPADGAEEAAQLNALWDGYVFRLPIEQVSKLLKSKQDLIRQNNR